MIRFLKNECIQGGFFVTDVPPKPAYLSKASFTFLSLAWYFHMIVKLLLDVNFQSQYKIEKKYLFMLSQYKEAQHG